MAKSKKKQPQFIFGNFLLPRDNDDLKRFIDSKKVDMMEHAVASIEYAVDNQLPLIEIFQFQDSEFVVMVHSRDFLPNLENIYNYYIENEIYELCDRVIKLKKRIGEVVKLNET